MEFKRVTTNKTEEEIKPNLACKSEKSEKSDKTDISEKKDLQNKTAISDRSDKSVNINKSDKPVSREYTSRQEQSDNHYSNNDSDLFIFNEENKVRKSDRISPDKSDCDPYLDECFLWESGKKSRSASARRSNDNTEDSAVMEIINKIPFLRSISSKKQRDKKKTPFTESLFYYICYLVLFVGSFLFMELAYHKFAYDSFDYRIYMIIIAALFFGNLFAFITALFPPKVRRFIGFALIFLSWVLICTQLVYFHIFGSSLSFSQFGTGGDAIVSFRAELKLAIGDLWNQLLILLIPSVVACFFFFIPKLRPENWFGWKKIIATFLLTVICWLVMLGLVQIGGKESYSCYELYHSNAVSTNLSVKILGVMNASRLELKFMIFGGGDDNDVLVADEESAESSGETGYNKLEIDFDTLLSQDTDSTLKMLDEYFSKASATDKNQYTGYFEGYNLIELCCESFSPVFIDSEMTPMLYQMYTEGFIFNNFYTPWESNTTNGEYTLCTGLFPDNSRSKSNGSFKASIGHELPMTLGNMFKAIGADSYGYHNYVGSYYNRNETYPTIGLDAKFSQDGMTFTTVDWHASDVEMMEQSVEEYATSGNQFFVHYMTLSGHYRYDYGSNAIVKKNWDKVKDLDYSSMVKGYIACNLELEYALEYLVDALEEYGVADNTVIALTCDHFPYGLNLDEYSELAGYDVDDEFGKYKNAFILWCPSMTESVMVEDAMCTVDILPTLLNLWGFEYDSRLLAGRDIFSSADHVAILSNGSFITDKVMYSSQNNETTYLVDESEVDANYVQDMIDEVKKRFTVSTQILNTDYYAHLDLAEIIEENAKNYQQIRADASSSDMDDGENNPSSATDTGTKTNNTTNTNNTGTTGNADK